MPLPDDMVQQEAQKKAQEQQNAVAVYVQKRFDQDLRAVVDTPAGRRVLFSLQRDAGFYHSIPVGPGLEFKLGQRETACRLRRLIEQIDSHLPARMELEWIVLKDEAPKPPVDAPPAV